MAERRLSKTTLIPTLEDLMIHSPQSSTLVLGLERWYVWSALLFHVSAVRNTGEVQSFREHLKRLGYTVWTVPPDLEDMTDHDYDGSPPVMYIRVPDKQE